MVGTPSGFASSEQRVTNFMEDTRSKRTILYGITAVFGILVLLLLLLLFFSRRADRGLKFWRASNAAQIIANGGKAVEIDFPTLNDDPAQYQNQFIRVSGNYQRPSRLVCANPSGPAPRWALLNGDLSLEAIGFEGVLRLVPDGMPMIVEGIWRRYDGPLGCNKGYRAVTWYLETVRIIAPNPLTNGNGTAVYLNNPDIITSTPPIVELTISPGITIDPSPTRDTVTPTLPTNMPTAVTTLPPVEMTETAVAVTLTGTPTPTRTPTQTVTPTWIPTATVDGAPTRTPIPTNTSVPAVTATSVNPGATSTSASGYPPPASTPLPTPY